MGISALCPKDGAANPLLPNGFEFPKDGAVPAPSKLGFASGATNRGLVCAAFGGGFVGVDVAFSEITNVILLDGVSFDESA